MSIDNLPSIERDALNLLLSGGDTTYRELRSQLMHVAKVERTETGAGVYAVFSLDDEAKPVQDEGTFQLSGVFAVSEKCGEIGFLLYVKDGLIDCLEAYGYEEAYPLYSDCNFKLEGHRKVD